MTSTVHPKLDTVQNPGQLLTIEDYYNERQNPHVRTTLDVEADIASDHSNKCVQKVKRIHTKLSHSYLVHKKKLRIVAYAILFLLYHAYLCAALAHNWYNALALAIMTALVWLGVFYYKVLVPYCEPLIREKYSKTHMHKSCMRIMHWRYISRLFYASLVLILIIFVAVDTRDSRFRLVSLAGMFTYILLMFLFSTNPGKVKWRPVFIGILLQFLFGLFILRWNVGAASFTWAADKITGFLNYVNKGSSFVYGYLASPSEGMKAFGMVAVFAFSFVIIKLGWLMEITMGTTAPESLSSAANIFLGMTESPLAIKPYFHKLTKSEIHAIMTGGFANIAGSVFAAYVSFGACPSDLLSASIMSAPSTLAVAKLFYPETEASQTASAEDLKVDASEDKNVLEAASNGATQAVPLVFSIIANLIVFIAFLAFFNDVMMWLGHMVGIECLTVERVLSYLFFPLACIMGPSSDVNEILLVAELLGIKTFVNEFVAYQRLGKLVECGRISRRAQLIATYSLCGFANLSSLGISIGGLTAICPQRKTDISAVAVRSLIAGSVACFMTTCIAGILINDVSGCGGPTVSLVANCTLEFESGACYRD